MVYKYYYDNTEGKPRVFKYILPETQTLIFEVVFDRYTSTKYNDTYMDVVISPMHYEIISCKECIPEEMRFPAYNKFSYLVQFTDYWEDFYVENTNINNKIREISGSRILEHKKYILEMSVKANFFQYMLCNGISQDKALPGRPIGNALLATAEFVKKCMDDESLFFQEENIYDCY